MTDRAGCRSCTDTRKCRSCARRTGAATMSYSDIRAARDATDFITQSTIPADMSSASSSGGDGGDDFGTSFCGDI